MIFPSDGEQRVMGIAWYRRTQWQRLLEISSDAGDLEESYDEWEAFASSRLAELRAMGLRIEKVDIDVEELLRWCRNRGVEVDGKARSEFAAEKIAENHRARE